MGNPLLLPELRIMLADADQAGLAEVMTELHAATIADFAEDLTVTETWQLLDQAMKHREAEVFSFFPIAKQVELATGAGRERMSQ
jgi:hypothetical protein